MTRTIESSTALVLVAEQQGSFVNVGRIVQRAAVEKCGAEVDEGLSLNQGVGAFQ
jgi:hypothetical protein